MPESKLENLLLYLNELEKSSEEKSLNNKLLEKIFEEDNDLLKVLAQ